MKKNQNSIKKLPRATFLQVVRNAPLVSVDLIIKNENGLIGLGVRRNEPAKGFYYFPGGRIFKDETIEKACGRILLDEMGVKRDNVPLKICGVNNWFFKTNFAGVKGVSTHYVALAVALDVNCEEIDIKSVNSQHEHFIWLAEDTILNRSEVHADVKHVIEHLRKQKA